MVEFIVSILRSNVIADFGKWYRVAGSASLGPMGNIGDHERGVHIEYGQSHRLWSGSLCVSA